MMAKKPSANSLLNTPPYRHLVPAVTHKPCGFPVTTRRLTPPGKELSEMVIVCVECDQTKAVDADELSVPGPYVVVQ